MSNEKLSELSKPVAYITAEGVAITPIDFESGYWGMRNLAMSDDMWCPLYSQEYVSALEQRAERLDAMLTESVQAQEDAEQRIAELKSDLSEWEDCKHEGSSWYDFSGHERCGKCGADK